MKLSTREYRNQFSYGDAHDVRDGKFTVTVVMLRIGGKTLWNLSVRSTGGRIEPVDLVSGLEGRNRVINYLSGMGRKMSDLKLNGKSFA